MSLPSSRRHFLKLFAMAAALPFSRLLTGCDSENNTQISTSFTSASTEYLGAITATEESANGDALLLESGSVLLLQNGDKLLLG